MVDRPGGGERGATLVLVALQLVALVGMVSLVVDIANGRLARQSLVPAADAAALAAAQGLVGGALDQAQCDALAASYVSQNATGADTAACVVQSSGARGRVTVTASRTVPTLLAGVLGRDGIAASASTTATWGPPAAVTGLRPLGLCLDSSTELQDVVADGTADDSITIPFAKANASDCGDAYGNWSFIDFDGAFDLDNAFPDLKSWLVGGYPEPVSLDPSGTGCGTYGQVACVTSFPGTLMADWSISWRLDDLEDERTWIWLPVFDNVDVVDGLGRMHVVAVVRAQLLSFPHYGQWSSSASIRIRVQPGLVTGPCCGDADGASGTRVIAICAVDPADPTQPSGTCGP